MKCFYKLPAFSSFENPAHLMETCADAAGYSAVRGNKKAGFLPEAGRPQFADMSSHATGRSYL